MKKALTGKAIAGMKRRTANATGLTGWLFQKIRRNWVDEVRRLLMTALTKRERDIICRYYGLEKAGETWEDIGKQLGLSRERVRQVGLVAMEKLKHAARRKKLEAMLVEH